MDGYFDFVWRSLRRLGLLASDADDATQEVFLVVSRKLPQILVGSERRFLFATALRVASTRRRGLRRRPEDSSETLDDHQHGAPDPERVLQLAQARRELDQIFDGMDLEQRAVFVLFELEELTVPEIASLLGTPVGTVSSRLRAAREHFQAAVKRLHARAAFAGGRS
jgi:RNA polymerase sigma-70 factor (ECF subfamily)